MLPWFNHSPEWQTSPGPFYHYFFCLAPIVISVWGPWTQLRSWLSIVWGTGNLDPEQQFHRQWEAVGSKGKSEAWAESEGRFRKEVLPQALDNHKGTRPGQWSRQAPGMKPSSTQGQYPGSRTGFLLTGLGSVLWVHKSPAWLGREDEFVNSSVQ